MLIASFPKNHRHEVQAALSEWEGKPTATLWVFALTQNGPKATRQGLSIARDQLPDLKRAVDALTEAAQVAGAD